VLEFETDTVTLVEEKTQRTYIAIESTTTTTTTTTDNNKYYNKQFKYFNNREILTAFKDIIQQIVKNGSIDVIVDHLMTECIDNVRLRLQTVFVLNEVIKACEHVDGK